MAKVTHGRQKLKNIKERKKVGKDQDVLVLGEQNED